ncbi:uncharacterized protein LOC105845532 [Hydra vulgaris]|uniref:uncharacterized protein LOC105845532 n=1 Tax=Hydra vulgaris TaxID=6087 RepID=UPI001F5FC3AA|nr:uncharacterized protein LOC105845532 [Hydra vulgaris]
MISLKIILLLLKLVYECRLEDALLEAVFYEQIPFIFKTSNGSIDGIIPKMFNEGEYYCFNESNKKFISFKTLLSSREEFQNLLHSESYRDKNNLLNGTDETQIWFPDDLYNVTNKEHKKSKNLVSFQIMKSDGLAVIMLRDKISLPSKVLRGIYSCRQIIALTVMMVLLFGMLIWFIECTYNNEFSLFFVNGAATGLWWSVVSMTTVGYGDVVPRSIPGKVIACVWLFIGVVISCLVTATVTEVVTGLEGLDIYEQKVSVLDNSYELKAAKEMYDADVVPVKTYEEAIKLVREEKVFAALMNVDVAAWKQNEIIDDNHKFPLRIVNVVKAHLYINCLISRNLSKSARDVFNCMNVQKDEVYTRSAKSFQRICNTEILYVDSIIEMFQKSTLYQLILGFLVTFICLGLGFEFYTRKKNCNEKKAHDFDQL